MLRSLLFAAGILIAAGIVLAQENIQQGKIKRIDADKWIVTLTVSGKDMEVTATERTRYMVEGREIKDGLKNPAFKEGAEVMFRAIMQDGKLVLQGMRVGVQRPGGGAGQPATGGKPSVGFKPLTEMSASDKYKGEDGGLYGNGKNEPPPAHQTAANKEMAKIVPVDSDGKPSSNGKIVLISISMSNATQEFSKFKQIADADPAKSKQLLIVDCAQGGQAMAQWAPPNAKAWTVAEERLQAAGVSNKQVQVCWIKLANPGPRGEFQEHAKKLEADTLAVVQNAKARFPNLRIAFLSSRIYGGYAATQLNPEPYAYEGAFAVRWLIQDQIKGSSDLNHDASRGSVKAPLLLWGPYFWADGMTPRKSDGLIWERTDLGGDGTHPTEAGRKKVAELLLQFFKTDTTAKPWFVGK